MPDVLSEAELAAIAAYKGPVTVVPRGAMSDAAVTYATVGIGWKEQHEADKRMFRRRQTFKALRAREEAAEAPLSARTIGIAARRDAVLRMAKAGRRHTEMAITLGVSLDTICIDVRFLREAGVYPSRDERRAAMVSA